MYVFLQFLQCVMVVCYICRGDEFRKSFAELGTVRSLVPTNVQVMALTATATRQTLDCVVERLSMKSPAVIGLSPEKDNITFNLNPAPTLYEFCSSLAKELRSQRNATPKTVVFCRSLKKCVDIYDNISRQLGKDITEPPGIPNVLPFRLMDLFTAASTADMREEILQEFCKPDTYLRLVIATTAFGLGVDCPDISRVINWGAPSTLEELIQESGRAGRDGRQSETILYVRSAGKHATKDMKQYVENSSMCRRLLLYKNFLFNKEKQSRIVKPCKCCDLCRPLCNCDECMH